MLLFSGMVSPSQTFIGRKRFRIKGIYSRAYKNLRERELAVKDLMLQAAYTYT